MVDELEDLQDQLSVMEGITDQLKLCESKAKRESVRVTQLLNQYILLEDRIIDDLLRLSQFANDSSSQEILMEISKKFNEIGSEYQDTWSEEFWQLYDFIRNGYSPRSTKIASLDLRIEDVIDIALNLRNNQSSSFLEDDVLKELDLMATGHKFPTIKKEENNSQEEQNNIALKKCMCTVF